MVEFCLPNNAMKNVEEAKAAVNQNQQGKSKFGWNWKKQLQSINQSTNKISSDQPPINQSINLSTNYFSTAQLVTSTSRISLCGVVSVILPR